MTTIEQLRTCISEHLAKTVGRFPAVATRNDWYLAVAHAVRDRVLGNWARAAQTYYDGHARTVAYLSAEFLLGPQLGKNLINLDLYDDARQAVAQLGLNLDELIDQEEEPGLGTGGLGRLAACYLDSLATLDLPAIGYGIRYEFGIFDQEIVNGWQVEKSDRWLRLGYPWEISRPEVTFSVKLGGRTESYRDAAGRYCVHWIADRVVVGTPCDTLIQGYRTGTVSLLRLWKAEACNSFDFAAFNVGDYYRAVREKIDSENISKILYPNDEQEAGRQLRLEQQYFFTSCALQDMIRIYQQRESNLANFHKKYSIQLNDTHPAIGIAELMRLLVDEHRMEWDQAWEITRNSFAYTNHTLMPEALEKWSLALLARVLPRHLEIILEINRRFMAEIAVRYPGDDARRRRLSLIDEDGGRRVRMANLACVGSRSINGVAELHTRLLRETVLKDFFDLWPEKFSNKTNGVSLRRFMLLANPGLSKLITEAIGDAWVLDPAQLRRLADLAGDAAFADDWRRVKRANKQRLADIVGRTIGVAVDPDTLFDIQVKRIHEYKRQHLNVLHVLTLYRRMRRDPHLDMTPRTVLFAGKAAPGYHLAKLMIRLVTATAEMVNADPEVGGRLRVAFLPDFNVKNAQPIYPAADLSEQISTAGTEASGTGNMKFSLNGALTIGTLDGANVEIRDEVGEERFFLFGMNVEQARVCRQAGYNPREVYEHDDELRDVIDFIASGALAHGDRELFQPLLRSLLDWDEYLVLADYRSYVNCQDRIARSYLDTGWWTEASIQNVARMGKFSADRAIREYARDIWRVEAKPVPFDPSDREAVVSHALAARDDA